MQVFGTKFYGEFANGKHRMLLYQPAMFYFKVTQFIHWIMPYFYTLH